MVNLIVQGKNSRKFPDYDKYSRKFPGHDFIIIKQVWCHVHCSIVHVVYLKSQTISINILITYKLYLNDID